MERPRQKFPQVILLFLLITLLSVVAVAQGQGTLPAPVAELTNPANPHDAGIYVSANKSLARLGPTPYKVRSTTGFLTAEMGAPMKWKGIVSGLHANVQVTDLVPSFYFYSAGNDQFVPDNFVLINLAASGDTRTTPIGKDMRKRENVTFTSTKVAQGVFKVTPTARLQPGEYCFIIVNPESSRKTFLFDFGVGGY